MKKNQSLKPWGWSARTQLWLHSRGCRRRFCLPSFSSFMSCTGLRLLLIPWWWWRIIIIISVLMHLLYHRKLSIYCLQKRQHPPKQQRPSLTTPTTPVRRPSTKSLWIPSLASPEKINWCLPNRSKKESFFKGEWVCLVNSNENGSFEMVEFLGLTDEICTYLTFIHVKKTSQGRIDNVNRCRFAVSPYKGEKEGI